MSIKGSRSRVKNQKAYGDTIDRIRRNERRKRKQQARRELMDLWDHGTIVIKKGSPLL